MRNVTSAWLAAQAKAPYFQTNDVPGYPNCTTVAAFVPMPAALVLMVVTVEAVVTVAVAVVVNADGM